MTGQKAQEQRRKEWIEDLANRLYTITDPWDREYASVQEVANAIEADPLGVIDYLVTWIEEV